MTFYRIDTVRRQHLKRKHFVANELLSVQSQELGQRTGATLVLALSCAFILFLAFPVMGVEEALEPEDAPGLVFENSAYAFGEVFEGEIIHTEFVGVNQSDKTINILRARASCGCTVAKVSKEVVEPGEAVSIDVKFDTTTKPGRARKRVWLETDYEAHPITNMYVEGVVNRTASGHPAKSEGKTIFSRGCANCHTLRGRNKFGAALYAADCAMCHGVKREGTDIAGALDWAYGSAKDEEALRATIAMGSTNPMMPGFSKQEGGPLTDDQVNSLTAWIRTQAEGDKELAMSNPPLVARDG